MKIKFFLIPLLLIISYQVLTNSSKIVDCVIYSFNIWKNNIFPSLFPLLILANLFISYGMVELLGELLKPLMRLFKINNNCSFIFVMSLLTGMPSSAIIAKTLYLDNTINEYDASKILAFSSFSNPLFLIVNLGFLDKKDIIVIIIIHYLTNIIIGIIFRNYYPYINKDKININNMINNMNKRLNNSNIGLIISNSIKSSINTLLSILGTITIFLCLTTIINNIFNFDEITTSIINGIFEITQGLKYLSVINIPSNIKGLIAISIISFGGLSIHMQVRSIISNTKIKYYPYLIGRLLHGFISCLLLFIYYLI